MYAKIFDSMYEGTLYGHWEAIVTLQQMLVLCDQNGVIDMTPQAISGKTSIPIEIINKGIEILSAPDPQSRTPGEEGRRIATVAEDRPWGWYIVNHAKYQRLKSAEEKREADRLRIAEKRKGQQINNVAKSRIESPDVVNVAHSDVYVDSKPPLPPLPTEAGKKKRVPRQPETPLPADFEVFEEMASWAKGKGLTDAQIDSETEKFIIHHKAKGSRWSDWESTWQKWILNAIKFGLEVKPPTQTASGQAQLPIRVA